ncbi:MAG TPA: hypothetical protein VF306_21995 [Pirellulales bacterium]
MNRFRTPLSAIAVWTMIPLAVFAGMPSTGCLCANGQFKFFCGHQYHADAAHGGKAIPGCCAADHAATADCGSCVAMPAAEYDGDCCQHSAVLPGDGVRSRSCCQPVFNAAGISPAKVSTPCGDSCADVCLTETIAIRHPAVASNIDEFDTGPPLDRVLAFRHLLI